MNKLAICISGSLRSIEYCLYNFIENIILPNQKEMKIVIFYYIPNDINATKIDVLKKTLEDICESFYLIKDDISLIVKRTPPALEATALIVPSANVVF